MATASDIIQPKNFQIERVTLGQPKKNANGGKTIYISYSNKIMYVQTPVMTAPFGISYFQGENGAPDKYSIDVSFAGVDGNEGLKSFYDMVDALDSRVVEEAMENSQAWFNKKFPDIRVLEAMRSPSIKLPKSEQYAPRFSMKLPFRDGKFTFPAYDSNRREIDLMSVINGEGKGKGSQVQAILQLSAWVVGPRFGVSWKVVQLRLKPPARLSRYAFQPTGDDLEDDDVEEEYTAAPQQKGSRAGRAGPPPAPAAGPSRDLVESSDDEAGGGAPSRSGSGGPDDLDA
jgi:hypothetical protein